MTYPDLINSFFEFGSSYFIGTNVVKLYKDKEVKGVNITPTVVFSLWGFWNLFYYSHLDQWASWFGGMALVIVNMVWVVMAVYYTRHAEKPPQPEHWEDLYDK